MGRTGGGGHSSGGSHSSHSSSSHSHSSHSSSRISSSSHSSYHSSSNSHSSHPVYVNMPYTNYGYRRRHITTVPLVVMSVIPFVIVMLMFTIYAFTASRNRLPESSTDRERLSGGSFTEYCVDDRLGWADVSLGKSLQAFWDATGVQPYVVLEPYSEAHDTPQERYDWADEYYMDYIGSEDAMLLVYFDDEPDGDWEMVCGNLTGSVLDPEAKEIVWGCLDRYWNDLDYSVTEAIGNGLALAGERMMSRTTNGMDVARVIALVGGILVILMTVFMVMKFRRQAKQREAEETERILNTPLERMGADNDPLVDKYDDDDI